MSVPASRFARDRRGNFTMMFALSSVAMVVIVGMGIDYFSKISTKARLNAAADAAALAAVNTAKAYYGAYEGTTDEASLISAAKTAGTAQGINVWKANVANTETTNAILPTIPVKFPGADPTVQQFTATVTWDGSLDSHFGSLVGISTLALHGVSTAIATMPQFLDFYVMTDVSGSMGIPTSVADQKTLILNNPDNATEKLAGYTGGCQFACHFAGYNGFLYTQKVGLPLKLNTVGQAIQGLVSSALLTSQASGVANQFRVGIYPFIVHAIQAVGLSTDMSTTGPAYTFAGNQLANYLDGGGTNYGMGSGGTHFEHLWNDMTSTGFLQTPGTGLTATSRKPFVVMVTDGVDNGQTYVNGNFNGSTPQLPDTTSNASFCTLAKNAIDGGYTVAVLLIPYVPIVDPEPIWNDEDAAVNYLIDPTTYIPPPAPYAPTVPSGVNASINMSKCASPGYFFSAGTAAEINTAMQTIFYQAVAQARLTQ